LLVRITRLDHRLLAKAVFFQAADIPVHRIAADPFLHYELKPSAQHHGTFPGKPPYVVTIDVNGARCPAHAAAKDPHTFRILAFGGSTLYGGAVSDSETLPAALERRLNREAEAGGRAGLHFEVWNFGTSAYTLGQATHLARQKLRSLSPDLVLVQHHNLSRRAFLTPEDWHPENYPEALFTSDPHFCEEQFYVPKVIPLATHQLLMNDSAIYRSVLAVVSRLSVACECCDRLSADEARALTRYRGAARPRRLLCHPGLSTDVPADLDLPGAPTGTLYRSLSARPGAGILRGPPAGH
jgi:hypothetical protein